jgi:hypothetical protein
MREVKSRRLSGTEHAFWMNKRNGNKMLMRMNLGKRRKDNINMMLGKYNVRMGKE